MGKYFDYSDWKLEEISNSIRERLAEAKIPLPKKIMKHFVSIRYKVGEGSYRCGGENEWMWNHDEFTSKQDAIQYMSKLNWLKRINDNMWIDTYLNETYIDKNGNEIPCHFEIEEYDSNVYEDEEYHIEYDEDEVNDLRAALYYIDKARAYMKVYDYANDNCSFGCGSFHNRVKEELNKFEEEYTENLPENYYEDNE